MGVGEGKLEASKCVSREDCTEVSSGVSRGSVGGELTGVSVSLKPQQLDCSWRLGACSAKFIDF